MKIQYPLSGDSPICICRQDIDVDGTAYTVYASFDKVLRIFDLIGDSSASDSARTRAALEILLCSEAQLPPRQDGPALLKAIIEHFSVPGDAPEEENVDVQGNPLPAKKIVETYRINHDGGLIYAAFMQAYGIDLIDQQGKLHWFKFVDLLRGLPDNTRFSEICKYRSYEKPSKKDTYEKQMMKLKEIYALPAIGGEDDG